MAAPASTPGGGLPEPGPRAREEDPRVSEAGVAVVEEAAGDEPRGGLRNSGAGSGRTRSYQTFLSRKDLHISSDVYIFKRSTSKSQELYPKAHPCTAVLVPPTATPPVRHICDFGPGDRQHVHGFRVCPTEAGLHAGQGDGPLGQARPRS